MPNYQGVWSLSTQYQAKGDNNWNPPLAGDIGLFARSATSTVIEFVNIASDGNAQDFGDHSQDQGNTQAAGSSTRAIFRIEYISSAGNVIEFCEIHKKGNTTDFGDVSVARYSGTALLSNQTRAVFAGGYKADDSGYSNVMDYVTIANTGNATDFGDLTVARDSLGALSSPTRGVFSMGRSSGGDFSTNVIDYITIGSTGNATDFGDLSVVRNLTGGASSNTRGLFMGGYNSSGAYSGTSSRLNVIDYITIASTGNATDFGDLSLYGIGGATSNRTKAVFSFGSVSGAVGSDTNTIDKVTIASTGNATDFGDASTTQGNTVKATSDSHGGLS